MNVLSLFSGIGGLDLGLERAGMTVVGQVEIDPWCRQILSKHWPEVPRHDDVRTAAEWWGDRAVDVVAGGFPCQPVSQAGRRKAQKDSRWLWPAFVHLLRHVRPRYVLVENVPGLLARGMGDVLGGLAQLGYDAEWDCLPAVFVGAPHIRNRVFIVAYPQGIRGSTLGTPSAPEAGPDAVAGHAGQQPGSLAYAGSARRREDAGGAPGDESQNARWPASLDGQGCRARLADADSPLGSPTGTASQAVFRPGAIERPGRCGCRDGHTWPAEPRVGRVAHGIPRRVDRLRGLGNAVVPQVAEHIGRLIMEASAA